MKIAGGVCVGVSLLLVPIIAVISGLGYEQSDAARNQAYEVAKCIDIFRSQHGRWPHDLDELVTPPRPHKAIMEALPRDPWGNAYLYFAPGWRNVDKVDVMSRGEDGIAFTDDDLGNWHD